MGARLIDRILALDNLRPAWEEVRDNGGAGGVDHISLRKWSRTWEERLVTLARSVRANTYQPRPLRRFSLPKKSGGYRHFAIPTITDRVLQRAVLRVLTPRCERLFFEHSYGYRPGRSVADAVRQVVLLRENGYRWVLDADVDECFDSLDHALIQTFFNQLVTDPITRRLIRQWLLVGRRDPEVPKGIPLGSVISPLLANLYLHRVDQRLTDFGYRWVRYADDFCVFTVNQQRGKQSWRDVAALLTELRLQLEPHKTCLTTFDEGFDYLGVHFEGNMYSYLWQDKRIEVKDDFDWLFYDYVPDGYR
ncbi:MAG: reverse transcriptase domain-containing protein [Chloroflexota bacterium]|nr:reverse transcriptase domain-containing protein [Chloroflexota bacterium]